MRIVFDAFWWLHGPPSQRHVLREMVMAWHALHPDDEIVLVVRRRDLPAVRAEVPSGWTVVGTRWWPQAALAAVACTRVARRRGADVVYTQNFAAGSRRVSAVFLHDVLFLTDPNWFGRVERAYFGWMPRLVRRADVVFTSSRTEADRIRTHTRAREVRAVGIGMSRELATVAAKPWPGVVPGSFLLTVGRLNVRKNLAVTIEAALASGVVTATCPLVVVGAANGKGEELPAVVAAAVAVRRVIFAGHVDDATLRWLYENARLFLFLSLGEGFGMPAAEAAFFGTPSLLSDIPVFAEIAPGAPRVPPTDVRAIADAIARLAVDPAGAAAPGDRTGSDVSASVELMRAGVLAHLDGATSGRRQ